MSGLRSHPRRVVGVLTALAVVLGSGVLTGTAPAASAASCTVAPVVRDRTVNQGLEAYSTLVRGKETLVRFYLSLPSCAAGTKASISLTGAKLEVRSPSGSSTVASVTSYRPSFPTSTPPALAPYASAPALDAAADPVFVVPASLLTPSTDAAFTASFRAVLTWTGKSTTGTAISGTTPATTEFTVTRAFDRKTSALRMLVVPMGNASQSYASQFDSVAQSVTAKGVAALGRMLPVPDAVGDLRPGSTGGVRYTVAPTLLDVPRGSDGKFCGRSSNFEVVKAGLGQFLQSYNAANPTAPADRVLGVVSSTLSSGASAGCAEGMAAIGGTQAWVRAIPDTTATRSTPSVPSMTGALMGMEIGHTMGLVPAARANPADSHHSPNKVADLLSPGRAYNVQTRTFLSTNRTALNLTDSWNNATTVYEPDDWATLLCTLGGSNTAVCDAPGSVGSREGVPAAPVFVLTGTTDGTTASTRVLESYFTTGFAQPAPTASPYELVQLDGTQVLRRDLVRVNREDSAHDHATDPATGTAEVQALNAVVPFSTSADRIELRHGDAVLYVRERTAPPVLKPASGGPDVLANFSQDAAADDRGPALSPDGAWVAWTRGPEAGSDVVVAPVSDRTAVSVLPKGSAVRAADPTWFPDGSALAVVVDGGVRRVAVGLTGGTASFGTSTTIIPTDLGLGTPSDPSISSDGQKIAFSADGEVLMTSAAGFSGFTVLSSNLAGVATSPSWSEAAGDGRLVFQHVPGLSSSAGATTTRVNVATGSAQSTGDGLAQTADVSGDGRHVVWTGFQSDLVAGDSNGAPDIFVRDRVTGTTERVSVSTAGQQANGGSRLPTISADGRYVAFQTDANNLSPHGAGIHLHDRLNGSTRRIDLTPAGTVPNGGPVSLAMDASGRYLAYASSATNLVAGDSDTNGEFDVFVTDASTGATVRASVASDGSQADGDSGLNTGVAVGRSAAGPVVAFGTTATNLVALTTPDGDANAEVVVRDVAAGTTQLASRSAADASTVAAGSDLYPAISADGRYVAFRSDSAGLVSGDTNGVMDVFRFDRTTGAVERASVRADGGQSSGWADEPSISDDGAVVGFTGAEGHDDAGAHPGRQGVFVRQMGVTTRRVSVTADGGIPNSSSFRGTVSGDGSTAAFWSHADDVVPGDTNGVPDLFVRGVSAAPPQILIAEPRVSGNTTRVTSGETPAFGDGSIAYVRDGKVRRIAPDGQGDTAVTDGPRDANPAVSGTRLAFDRPESATGRQRDIWIDAAASAGSYTVESAQPENVRISLYYDCDGYRVPVAVGLTPAQIDAAAEAFAERADAALLCEGGTLVAVASDGFSLAASATTVSTAPVAAQDDPPVVTIAGPAAWTSLLQYGSVGVSGSARDPEDGLLTGDALSWTVEDASGRVVATATGGRLELTAPSGAGSTGFAPGDYTVVLTATAGGTTVRDTLPVQVVADADHDGLSAAVEAALAGAGCAGSDTDPSNAFGDCDGDGISNVDDLHTSDGPTTAASTYNASVVLSPDPYATASGASLSAAVTLAADRVKNVTGSSVRISSIAGEPVPGSAGLTAISWRVKGSTGTATFSGSALRSWLTARGLVGRQVNVEVTGTGTATRRGGPTFTFTAVRSLTTS